MKQIFFVNLVPQIHISGSDEPLPTETTSLQTTEQSNDDTSSDEANSSSTGGFKSQNLFLIIQSNVLLTHIAVASST